MSALEVPYVVAVGSSVPPYPTGPPVAGYVGWYDADDPAVLTMSSQNVTAWADKSASNNDLTSGTGILTGRDPTTLRTVLQFAHGGLLNTSISTSSLTFSAFVACCPSAVAVLAQTLIGPSGDGGNQFRLSATTGALQTARADVDTKGTQGNADPDTGVPFVAGQVLTAADVTHYTNTVSETDASITTFTAARTLAVGYAPSVSAGIQDFGGWIGEVIIYSSTVSSGDADDTVAYLMDKWEIT